MIYKNLYNKIKILIQTNNNVYSCLFIFIINCLIDEYTYIMMKQSTIPEIKNFAKNLDIEEYWNNNSDNIFIEDETNVTAFNTHYNIGKNLQNLLKLPPLNLTNHLETDQCALISPTLTFNKILPTSPNIYFIQNKYKIDEININTMHNTVDNQIISNKNEIVSIYLKNKTTNELSLQRYIYINI